MHWGAGCDREFRLHPGTEGHRSALGQGFVVQGTPECTVQCCRKNGEIIRHWELIVESSVPLRHPNMVSYYSHIPIVWLHLYHSLMQTFLYVKKLLPLAPGTP